MIRFDLKTLSRTLAMYWVIILSAAFFSVLTLGISLPEQCAASGFVLCTWTPSWVPMDR